MVGLLRSIKHFWLSAKKHWKLYILIIIIWSLLLNIFLPSINLISCISVPLGNETEVINQCNEIGYNVFNSVLSMHSIIYNGENCLFGKKQRTNGIDLIEFLPELITVDNQALWADSLLFNQAPNQLIWYAIRSMHPLMRNDILTK